MRVTAPPKKKGKTPPKNTKKDGRFRKEKKQMEEDIRRLAMIVRDSNDAITMQDFEGRITAWNHGAELMYGYSEEEALQMNIWDLTPHSREAEQKEFTCRLIAGEIIPSFETQRLAKDGRILDIWLTVTELMDDAGKPISIASTERDITERKKAEEALRESEALLNATQRLSKVGGWEWDVEKQSMFWTEETYRIHDLVPGEIVPGSPEHIARSSECYEPEDRPVILDAFQRCAEQGQPYDLEFPFTTVTGRRLWIRTTAQAVRDSGRIVKVVGNIMDITERKKAEKAIQDSALQWKTTFDAMKDAVSLIDSDGKIVRCNKAMIDFLKKPLGEIIGHTCWEIKRGSPSPDAGCLLGRVLQTHRRETMILPMGDQWFNITIDPLLDDSGNLVGGVHIISDITERKRAEEELMRSKNEVEFLNDLMSHDLSNINQAILGFLELLGETELSEKQKRYFSSAMYSARRNARLIDNVKKIQKSRFGPLSPTDLNACIEEAMNSILPPPEKIIKINYTPHPCLVLGNDLLKDVVSNLLDNAIKFDTSEEVIIDIAISDEGDMCKLSVADRGSGIPDQYKKSIFSRWERLEKGIRGGGLGLHLVKTIVEGCGGEVRVEDNSPKGSIFSILLRKVG